MPEEELSGFEATLHVPTVVAGETLYLLRPDTDDESKLVKVPVDLTEHFAHGVLRACDVETGDETDLFVQYATRLDDGEAACLAIAKNRGWVLATDDRLATKFANQAGVPALTTAELVEHWATKTRATRQQIAAVLLSIQTFAKFIPRENSPGATWWMSHFTE